MPKIDCLSTLFEMPPGRGSSILLQVRVTANQSPKYTSHRHGRHVNCGSHGTNVVYLDWQLAPVRLTEH